MKKKLSKLDVIILAMFFIGSISGMVGMKYYMDDYNKTHQPDTPMLPSNVTQSNISMPFCYHNGTCTTAPRDYSVP